MLQTNSAGEELSGIFRSVATKRKHGVLVVEALPSRFDIYFQNGRIAFVTRADQNPVNEICHRLINAGKLDREYIENTVADLSGIERLYEHLVEERGLAREVFLRALRAYQIDTLHSLRTAEVLNTTFHAKVVTLGEMFTVSISAGQLLLDLVEIEADEERFANIFGDLHEADVCVEKKRKELVSGTIPIAEELWGKFSTACAMRDLAARALQCEHDVKSALLALYDSDAISISHGDGPARESDSHDLEDREALLARMEQEFGDEDGFDLFGNSEPPSQGLDEIEQEERFVGLADQLWERRDSEELTAPPIVAADGTGIDNAGIEVEEAFASSRERLPLGQQIAEWNCLLREDRGLRFASALVVCVVLSLSALVLPRAVSALFTALHLLGERPLPWGQF